MHRNYSPTATGTRVQVKLFVDRLEITNPGGVHGTATKANLEDAQITSNHNQRLASALMPCAEIQASVTHFHHHRPAPQSSSDGTPRRSPFSNTEWLDPSPVTNSVHWG